MAGMNTTPGNWGRGYRSSPKVSKGFSGSRGFSMPKTASGKVARMTQNPLRGEEDLYSLIGQSIGDEISPYSAAMGHGMGQYIPPGTGVGSEYEGYGSNFMSEYGSPGDFYPSGAGDLLEQGSGNYEAAVPGYPVSVEDPGYAITGTKDYMSSPIWGLGKGLISPMPGYGEDEGFGGYMGEDFMGEFLPPSYLPKEKPNLKPEDSPSANMWDYQFGIGLGYTGTHFEGGESMGMAQDEGSAMDPGFEKFQLPSRMVSTDAPLTPKSIKRRGVICPPGDPNCR